MNKYLSILIGVVIILFLGLGYVGITIYNVVTREPDLEDTDLSPNVNPIIFSTPKEKEYSKYSCDGRVWCSDMTSCDEAKFFIRNCPGTKMDGNGDGIPCERQWCNN